MYTCVLVFLHQKQKLLPNPVSAAQLYSQLCNFQNKSEACLIFTGGVAYLCVFLIIDILFNFGG